MMAGVKKHHCSCAGNSASKTRVNALVTRASSCFAFARTKKMDCRVKPGNDER
jgi:hypothetical protein